MSLDQKTLDNMTLLVAREVLDDADDQMEQWKRERDSPHFSKPLPGGAPLGGLSDILPIIYQVLIYTWNWCLAHADDLAVQTIANVLSALALQKLTEVISEDNSAGGPSAGSSSSSGLTDEEIQAIVAKVVEVIIAELEKRNVIPPRQP